MRTAERVLVIVATTTALALPAAPALAGPLSTSNAFGQHVSTCAQDMGGFTGTHNPGMHRGAAGWDSGDCVA